MKGINFNNIGLGMELSPSFSKQSQEGLLERLQAMLIGLTNNAQGVVILSGCVMTIVGSQYNQTAGIVYYQGEILTVDAFAGNSATQIPVYQAATTTYTGQAWYGDGAKRDTFYVRKLPMALGASGSGISDYNSVVRIEQIKANKAQSAWTNLALVNGWANFVDSLKYKVDEFGKVHISGHISAALATNPSFCTSLPTAIRPTIEDQIIYTPIFDGTNYNVLGAIAISTSGNLQAFPGVSSVYRYKINVSYWTDQA